MTAAQSSDIPRAAFTLVEMLISSVILAALVLGVSAILNHSARTIRANTAGLDALRAGEASFSTLARDAGLMVVRPDVDYGFGKNAGNDTLSFYARSSGLVPGTSSPVRPLSVVAYRIGADSAGQPRLEYAARQIGWKGAGNAPEFIVSPFVQGLRTPKLDGSGTLPVAGDFTTLAGEIIRLELCFLVQENPDTPARLSATPPAEIGQVKALVAAAVVLDERGRALASSLSDLAGLFPDAIDGQDLRTIWESISTDASTLESAGLPIGGQSGLRIVQRYFPVTP